MSLDNKKAVVLLSGGLDSATVLAMAKADGCQCYALSFDYGQRHSVELKASRQQATLQGVVDHRVLSLDIGGLGGSALTDERIDVPDQLSDGIPVTYVPARNTVFLSIALGWAEVLGAAHIYIGVNAVDYSGYPDCRPDFIAAFEQLANLATKAGVEGDHFCIQAPLIHMTKGDIILQGLHLGVDYGQTVSCYAMDDLAKPCGVCDACRLRAAGFVEADCVDPALI